MLVRFFRCEAVNRLDTVSLPSPLTACSFRSPSSLAPWPVLGLVAVASADDRVRECFEERDDKEGKRVFLVGVVGVGAVLPFAGAACSAPLTEAGSGFVMVGVGPSATAGLGSSVLFMAGVPLTAGLSSEGPVPFVAGVFSSEGPAMSVGGFSSTVALAGAGTCVDGASSGAGADAASGGEDVSAVEVPSTTVVSSGLLSDTSARGAVTESEAGSVLRGSIVTGTIGATGAGSEGRSAAVVSLAATSG